MPGDWIITYSGGRFRPLSPRPEDISIYDVAHALSNICRFTGHVSTFYSVAEHSLIVSDMVLPEHALWGLMHDASEAYVNDMARPLKHSPEMDAYRAAEDRVLEAVAERFGLALPVPAIIKKVDQLLAENEMAELFPGQQWRHRDGHPLVREIECLSPLEAERRFLARFRALRGSVYDARPAA